MKKQISLLVALTLILSVFALPINTFAASTAIVELNETEKIKLTKIESSFDNPMSEYFDVETEYDCQAGAKFTLLDDADSFIMFITLYDPYADQYESVGLVPDGHSRSELNEHGQLFDLKKGATFTFDKPGCFYYDIQFTDGTSAGGYINVFDENGNHKYYESLDEYLGNEEYLKKYAPIPVVSKTQNLLVGKSGSMELTCYNILDNNYLKLRDIALFFKEYITILEKCFEVTWDEEKNAINLITNKEYTTVAGDGKLLKDVKAEAVLSTSKVYLDGKLIPLTAYTINSNNYFKLRDLCEALDVSISWWENSQVIYLNDECPYGEVFEDPYDGTEPEEIDAHYVTLPY